MIKGHNHAQGARMALAVAAGSINTLNMPVSPAEALGRSSLSTGMGGGFIRVSLIIQRFDSVVRYPVKVMNRIVRWIAGVPFLCLAAAAYAQVLPVSDGPVRMGHLHIYSANPELQKHFWQDGLGAQYAKADVFDIYKVPGVLVVVQKGEARSGTDGSSVNHIAVKVRDLKSAVSKCQAAGASIVTQNAQQAMLMGPDQVKVELTDDGSLGTPVANHHVHFYTYDPNEMRNWYVDFFGAKPGMRGRFKAADLPGVNLTFTQVDSKMAGTRGRSLDHIGFEVHELEAFTKKLQDWGVAFAVPYRKVPSLGIAIAFVSDPWGTSIELTEGLDQVP